MKNLFATFKRSLYDPAFYRAASLAPFGDALRYYVKIALVFALFMTVVFSILLVPYGVRFIKERGPEIVKTYYPAELVVTVKDGEASTNVTEPYLVPARGEMKQAFMNAATPVENLLVIDTTSDFDKKTFESHKTLALLTKHEIVTQSNRGQITIQELRGAPNVLVSQEVVLLWVEKIQGSLGAFVPFGIILTFIVLFFGFIMYLVPVLLFALVPLFIAWIKKMPLSYASAYKMSMYAIVPGLALKTLLNSLGFFSAPASLTFLVFLLVIALNMREEEQPSLFEGK